MSLTEKYWGEYTSVTLSSQSLIVKPEVAQRQFDADEKAAIAIQPPQVKDLGREQAAGGRRQVTAEKTGTYNLSSISSHPVRSKRFHGSIKLDALRLRRDAGQIADEIIQHFTSLVSAEVEITLEVQVSVPDGVPDNVVRTISENCRVLKFTTQEFEND